ncbi:tRNA-intron lyase [Halococcus saccharolyticus]|uniref:tRNA-splicing endonuclease n=1 Tax=Halococcus saccharolyticus DSM 5350 TaxID=1227455 RepID=M0MES3_9EURY|nr:tRNA-intron lyase [Halococcus saccharolyticus]EMA43169.1 tRNA splicing endonuclease [Halococcus saccharolyticus DSM 5350]
MEGRLDGDVVRVGGDARQRYYDSSGYGRPTGEGVALAPVEAAHLLFRGDLDAVDGLGFREFLAIEDRLVVRFLVYRDFRERGFYLSPAREGWVDASALSSDATPDSHGGDADAQAGPDLIVYPQGKGPWDDTIAYRIWVVGEREPITASSLGKCVLAVVDEESEITYLDTSCPTIDGSTTNVLPTTVSGDLLADRAILWNPPDGLYEAAFYGQRLAGRGAEGGPLQLSLVETAYLLGESVIDLGVDLATVVERGRRVEGERFDRRLAVYTTLREAGLVPKTGFKFGADFRTYADVESVDDLGHSERLVRVLPADHAFAPRELSLDVRLAGGVHKRMTFALTTPTGDVDWLAVERLTP